MAEGVTEVENARVLPALMKKRLEMSIHQMIRKDQKESLSVRFLMFPFATRSPFEKELT